MPVPSRRRTRRPTAKRPRRKLPIRRKRNRQATIAKLYRFPGGVADQTMVKVRYCLNTTFSNYTSSPTGIVTLVVAGDNPHDPGQVLDTRQANYFPQWSAFYNKYICAGSKITAKFINEADDNKYLGLRAIPNDEITASEVDSVVQLMTDPNARWTTATQSVGGSGSIKSLSMYRSTKAVLGLKSLNQGSSQTSTFSRVLNSTQVTWNWMLTLQSSAGTQTSGSPSTRALITIVYYLQFMDRKDHDMTA